MLDRKYNIELQSLIVNLLEEKGKSASMNFPS